MQVELIDSMGNDLAVVNAARVSFNKESDLLSEKDEKLIKYLADHDHWTPFSHCQITLRETVPIFVARQRFKHTVGFSYNEVSRRYVDDEPEFYIPTGWRKRPEGSKKQGSSNELIDSTHINGHYQFILNDVLNLYNDMIAIGIAPEQARMVLPQSMYTSYYVTGSLPAFSRAYNLRSDPHAQKEIQDLAAMWNTIIQPLFPVSWSSLTRRVEDGNVLTQKEI
jgi:thymidylate synthase (FAD)